MPAVLNAANEQAHGPVSEEHTHFLYIPYSVY